MHTRHAERCKNLGSLFGECFGIYIIHKLIHKPISLKVISPIEDNLLLIMARYLAQKYCMWCSPWFINMFADISRNKLLSILFTGPLCKEIIWTLNSNSQCDRDFRLWTRTWNPCFIDWIVINMTNFVPTIFIVQLIFIARVKYIHKLGYHLYSFPLLGKFIDLYHIIFNI